MFRNEFLQHEGTLYIIKKVLPEQYNPNIDAWKDHLIADKVFRRDGKLYFVETVPEAEIIEEFVGNVVPTEPLQTPNQNTE